MVRDGAGWLVSYFFEKVIESCAFYYILPGIIVVTVIMFYKIRLIKRMLKKHKGRILGILVKYRFEAIFRRRDLRQLEEGYLRNAMRMAGSYDKKEKLSGLQQLLQFYREDYAFDGLIGLLAKEKDLYNRYLYVEALWNIYRRRIDDQ